MNRNSNELSKRLNNMKRQVNLMSNKSVSSIDNETNKSLLDGLPVVISLITLSVFLYVRPEYLGYKTVSMIISIIVVIIGFIGLSIELNKIGEGVSDFIIGLIFLIIWGTVYHFYSVVWLNAIMLFFMVFGIYGTSKGLIKMLFGILSNPSQGDKKKRLIILIIQLIGFGATILQYLTSFKIMK
jgi:hypothetical protein